MGDVVKELLDRANGKAERTLDDLYAKTNTVYDMGSTSIPAVSLADSGSKPKKKVKEVNGVEIVSNEDDLPMTASNVQYRDTYTETDNVLKSVIVRLEIIANDIQHDIAEVRSAKTIKNKYGYLSDLTSALGSVVGHQLTAVKELNSVNKNCHELELKRMKELKLDNQQDDAKMIMDTYNAFVSMPVSSNPINGYASPLGPNTADITLPGINYMAQAIGQNPNLGFENYLNNMKPEQRLMLAESDPDIKQVVLYDPRTGAREFAMMNVRTQERLNLPTRDNSFLADGQTTFDFLSGKARNVNLDEAYDIITVGGMQGMNLY